jgi:hypothetical protein
MVKRAAFSPAASVARTIRGAAFAAFVLFASSSYAGEAVTALSAGNFSHTPTNFKGTYTYRITDAANQSRYVNRDVTIPKRGSPFRWLKKSPIEVAAFAAVASAGYVIDELSGQIMSPATTGDDPTWVSGYRWETNSSRPNSFSAGLDPVEQWTRHYVDYEGATGVRNVTETGSCSVPTCSYEYKAYSLEVTFGGPWYGRSGITIQHVPCTIGTTACTDTAPQVDIDQQPAPAEEIWSIVNPLVDAATLQYWARDSAGNPRIYPEVKAEQEALIGSEGLTAAIPYSVTQDDPYSLEYAPDVFAETAPVEIEFPDDYAREDTARESKLLLQNIKDLLEEPDPLEEPDAQGVLDEYATIKTDVENTTTVLGSLPSLPTLNGGGQCPVFEIPSPMGGALYQTDAYCDFFSNKVNPAVNFFLYLITALYLVRLYKDETTRAI